MNQKQFDVLVSLHQLRDDRISQRKIAQKLKISLGSVNSILAELHELNMIQDSYKLTLEGQAFLEEHKVERAIIIAAGFGERLMPLTLNTAKPLLHIHNVRLIDSVIDMLHKQGIEEIIIVRGHLKNQFDVLLDKYPNLKFIDNDLYNESKNINSIYLAREYLENTYICEADLLVKNPDMISPYQLNSVYYGKKKKMSNDWCFTTKAGIITQVSIGGKNIHEMVGISFWNKQDGLQLQSDIDAFIHSPGGMELFWDDVPLKLAKQNYQIHISDCDEDDIIEINTFSQIKAMDPIYRI